MKSLTDKIKKLAEWDDTAMSAVFNQVEDNCSNNNNEMGCAMMGAKFQNKKTELLAKCCLKMTEALSQILGEGNLAAQGHWDATDNMKNISYAALSDIEKMLGGDG
jgi:hypothetical protein